MDFVISNSILFHVEKVMKYYILIKQERLSNEAITILSMNPEERTDEQCKLALLALNHSVKAFGEFPKAMQKSLVRVGWYEK